MRLETVEQNAHPFHVGSIGGGPTIGEMSVQAVANAARDGLEREGRRLDFRRRWGISPMTQATRSLTAVCPFMAASKPVPNQNTTLALSQEPGVGQSIDVEGRQPRQQPQTDGAVTRAGRRATCHPTAAATKRSARQATSPGSRHRGRSAERCCVRVQRWATWKGGRGERRPSPERAQPHTAQREISDGRNSPRPQVFAKVKGRQCTHGRFLGGISHTSLSVPGPIHNTSAKPSTAMVKHCCQSKLRPERGSTIIHRKAARSDRRRAPIHPLTRRVSNRIQTVHRVARKMTAPLNGRKPDRRRDQEDASIQKRQMRPAN